MEHDLSSRSHDVGTAARPRAVVNGGTEGFQVPGPRTYKAERIGQGLPSEIPGSATRPAETETYADGVGTAAARKRIWSGEHWHRPPIMPAQECGVEPVALAVLLLLRRGRVEESGDRARSCISAAHSREP